MENVSENKVIVSNFVECLNNRDDTCMERSLTEDYVHHSFRDTYRGREEFRNFMKGMRSAFPDLRMDVVEQVAEGDAVVNRVTLTGTHKGTFEGFAATNRKVSWSSMVMFHLEDGRIKEQWVVANTASLLGQLGATNSGPGPKA